MQPMHISSSQEIRQTNLVDTNSFIYKAVLLIVFILAALIRRDEIMAPGHLIEREYTSAIFARAFYFEGNSNISEWRQKIALDAKAQQPILEPPITEYLVVSQSDMDG